MLLWLMGLVTHFHPDATPPPGALELTGNKWPTGLVWTVMLFRSRRGAPGPGSEGWSQTRGRSRLVRLMPALVFAGFYAYYA
jgi:hypothetical protein